MSLAPSISEVGRIVCPQEVDMRVGWLLMKPKDPPRRFWKEREDCRVREYDLVGGI